LYSRGYLRDSRQVPVAPGPAARIALAQALLGMSEDRKILVLDEFTGALDSETEERILRNLEPWLAGQYAEMACLQAVQPEFEPAESKWPPGSGRIVR
jgi:ABC-type dipeptide/oligopeptide/nickel transport system ATPase subunit